GEDQNGIRRALIALLQLVIENIAQLVVDDQWLTGQLSILQQAFAQPLDIRALDEVERRLRDVIDQQGRLKKELSDAQQRLKQMLAGFVDRLADMSRSAGSFHDTLEVCADRIETAVDISELSDVVEEMLRETRIVQEDARRSKDDLASLQQQVEMANSEIAKLQTELHNTSELVRHDPLTGILNRKGLDEALKREIARAQRRESPLCIGLLDIDNFKRINDTHGHHTGDAALQHLTEVVKDNLRPQDSVGRYGGEEFLILLPDTDVEHAVAALKRLQRALTNRYFLAEGQKMLITFSAGVARVAPDEAPEAAVDRADKAMYRAKRAGKNRVMMA
ncbi:MAG: diguanylate cyclase, partial [Rhodocyclaceae bacterium]|nr:diguanylate cyclase [Rhodocyclaceae bacterium]